MDTGDSDVVACGDFNLELLSLNENSSSQVVYNAMNAVSLILTIFKPDRIAAPVDRARYLYTLMLSM